MNRTTLKTIKTMERYGVDINRAISEALVTPLTVQHERREVLKLKAHRKWWSQMGVSLPAFLTSAEAWI